MGYPTILVKALTSPHKSHLATTQISSRVYQQHNFALSSAFNA
jgi:hypothetical protein